MAKSEKNLESQKAVANQTVTPMDSVEYSVQQKLIALYQLQEIYSQIYKIRVIRGELPLEVRDLEDACAGLETRIQNYTENVDELGKIILAKNEAIKEAKALIKRYEEQQNNV